MKKTILILFIISAFVRSKAQSKTYFLSPEGDDANSGLSINAPWKTLEKVNQFTFQPGDQLLLKSGETWNGQMKPQGESKAGNPIVISSYSGNKKPIIDIDDDEGG